MYKYIASKIADTSVYGGTWKPCREMWKYCSDIWLNGEEVLQGNRMKVIIASLQKLCWIYVVAQVEVA